MKSRITLLLLVLPFLNKPALAQQTAGGQLSDSLRLNHIAMYVHDLKKSAPFYKAALGLVQVSDPFNDGLHAWFDIGPYTKLHLIQGAKNDIPRDKNDHLCFSVRSVDDFVSRLKKNNIPYSNWKGEPQAVTTRVDGVKQLYFQDPDGHWIEINDDGFKH